MSFRAAERVCLLKSIKKTVINLILPLSVAFAIPGHGRVHANRSLTANDLSINNPLAPNTFIGIALETVQFGRISDHFVLLGVEICGNSASLNNCAPISVTSALRSDGSLKTINDQTYIQVSRSLRKNEIFVLTASDIQETISYLQIAPLHAPIKKYFLSFSVETMGKILPKVYLTPEEAQQYGQAYLPETRLMNFVTNSIYIDNRLFRDGIDLHLLEVLLRGNDRSKGWPITTINIKTPPKALGIPGQNNRSPPGTEFNLNMSLFPFSYP